ncbi:DUF59 domain-containing protein [Candidatus Woesearchaeota archaeon]|nr:DUF59 domain-containing protein [Candidatus Woesearchaeota archaeon]
MINKETVIETLKKVLDPEILMDVWTLGLVYGIDITEGDVSITMTLTSPMCPYGPQLLAEVEQNVRMLQGVTNVAVHLTFEPAWEPSADLKMQLGLI